MIPLAAQAEIFDLHVGGICSTNFGSTLGKWSGETSVNAPIDQTSSMATATVQMAATLDKYCTGNNLCYVYVYSNGGAVMSRTLALYSTPWNIGYVSATASNEGGSELGGTGYLAQVFGQCALAGHIGTSDHRNGWNHNDSHGVVTGMVAGNGWLAPYVQSGSTDDPLTAYRRANVYPPTSRPLSRVQDDLLRPGQRHETMRSGDRGTGITYLFTADRYFVFDDEALTAMLEVQRDGEPIAVTITFAHAAVVDPGGGTPFPIPVTFTPSGTGATSVFVPSRLGLARQTTISMSIEFDHGDGRQAAHFDVQYTPERGITRPYPTDAFSDAEYDSPEKQRMIDLLTDHPGHTGGAGRR